MQIAIVGLAGSGKTTVFNTLTRGHAETGGYGGLQLNVGVVKVPDGRLDKLAAVFKPKKIVHADVTYVDLPAPPASTEGKVGAEELPAEHLARLRDGRLESLQTSSLHLDMLRDLKRINAHLVSVAYPILDESGLLVESRLRGTE